MAKTYKNIQAFLGLDAMEVPSDNSLFLVETLNDTLEERIGEAISKEKLLSAKMEEIVKNNDTINQLRANIVDKDAAITEKENTIATLNDKMEKLTEQINELTSDSEGKGKSIVEKDNTIADLNKQIETLNNTIAEKDAELSVLAGKTTEVPRSHNGGTHSAEESRGNVKGPHNVATEGMTLREKAEALEKRNQELLGIR